MLLLPAATVAAIFSMSGFFSWVPGGNLTISPHFWIYWVVTIPITVLVLVVWAIWLRWNQKREQMRRMTLKHGKEA